MVGRDYGSARYTSADLDSQIRLADDGLCFLNDEGALEASLQLDPGCRSESERRGESRLIGERIEG